MRIQERELQSWFVHQFREPEGRAYLERQGFYFDDHLFYEYRLSDYGRVDLLSLGIFGLNNKKLLQVQIVELKATVLNVQHLQQVSRYIAGCQVIFEDMLMQIGVQMQVLVEAFLVVPSLPNCKGINFMLNETSIQVCTYNQCPVDGFKFRWVGRDARLQGYNQSQVTQWPLTFKSLLQRSEN